MAENSSIQGLNVVKTANNYSTTSGETIDRGSVSDFDLALDLWGNISFSTTEEPFFSAERDTASRSRHKKSTSAVSRDPSKEPKASSHSEPSTNEPALNLLSATTNPDPIHDPLAGLGGLFANPALFAAAQQQAVGRFNPFMFPWPAPTTIPNINATNATTSNHQTINFNSLLSGFPVDPFLVPPSAIPHFVPPFGPSPSSSLPPLTVRRPEDPSPETPTTSGSGSTGGGIFAIDPTLALAPVSPSPSAPLPTRGATVAAAAASAPATTAAQSPVKRQKTSTNVNVNVNTNTNSMPKKTTPADPPPTVTSPVDENKPQLPREMTPLTAAEDKRRRNTAASARFRAKKKEREAAMEQKAKGLEERVIELERECESLRKENGWLKGLVVGATAGDPIDFGGIEDMLNAVKAAAMVPAAVVESRHASEEKVGSKRKRTTA